MKTQFGVIQAEAFKTSVKKVKLNDDRWSGDWCMLAQKYNITLSIGSRSVSFDYTDSANNFGKNVQVRVYAKYKNINKGVVYLKDDDNIVRFEEQRKGKTIRKGWYQFPSSRDPVKLSELHIPDTLKDDDVMWMIYSYFFDLSMVYLCNITEWVDMLCGDACGNYECMKKAENSYDKLVYDIRILNINEDFVTKTLQDLADAGYE